MFRTSETPVPPSTFLHSLTQRETTNTFGSMPETVSLLAHIMEPSLAVPLQSTTEESLIFLSMLLASVSLTQHSTLQVLTSETKFENPQEENAPSRTCDRSLNLS